MQTVMGLALAGDCDDSDSTLIPTDVDGDGFSSCDGDCDDLIATTYPGAAENDSTTDCMSDADEDGYGDTDDVQAPLIAGTDCDDLIATTHPGRCRERFHNRLYGDV